SARELMFGRAIGFAPNGVYWRMLRGISASHLFAPRRIAAHEPSRQEDCRSMLMRIGNEMNLSGSVKLRSHLQATALSNIMGSVFGKRKFNASSIGRRMGAGNSPSTHRRGRIDLAGSANLMRRP
ncbi:hypothetical protein ZOSMA_4706G00010, partial [Zostera marina]